MKKLAFTIALALAPITGAHAQVGGAGGTDQARESETTTPRAERVEAAEAPTPDYLKYVQRLLSRLFR